MLTKSSFKILIFSLFSAASMLEAQHVNSMEYRDAIIQANLLYQDKQFKKSAEAFEIAFQIPQEKINSMDRFDAAQANAKIKNAEKTEQYLYEVLPDIHPAIVQGIKTDYDEFDMFRNTDWWKKFILALDKRQAKILEYHKKLKIFKSGDRISYAAMRINSKGDTVANTFIHLDFEGKPYIFDSMHPNSSLATITYEYEEQDKIDHKKELKKTNIRNKWISSKDFAVAEIEELTALSPFYHNEFYKTWVAPEPIVYYPISDATIMKAGRDVNDFDHKLGRIDRGYLAYRYNGKVKMQNELLGELIVHHYKATKKTNIYGTNNLDYFFHEEHGFVAMIYNTFDGDIISFIRTESPRSGE